MFSGKCNSSCDAKDIDKRQERRTAAIQCLQKLAFANLIVSTATIGVGIGAAVITSRYGVKWPVFNLAPLILGIIMFIAGVLGVLAHRKASSASSQDEVSNTVYRLYMGYYIMSNMCCGLGCTAMAFSFNSLAACAGAQSDDKYAQYCQPDKTAVIVIGAVAGFLCFLIVSLSISAMSFHCKYAKLIACRNKQTHDNQLQPELGQWGQTGNGKVAPY